MTERIWMIGEKDGTVVDGPLIDSYEEQEKWRKCVTCHRLTECQRTQVVVRVGPQAHFQVGLMLLQNRIHGWTVACIHVIGQEQ